MCGIAGIVRSVASPIDLEKCKSTLQFLLLESQSRGKDSSGAAVAFDDRISVIKKAVTAEQLLRTAPFRSLLKEPRDTFFAIGHSRMETNGSFKIAHNNQPVIKDGLAMIHNGIIVNDAELWAATPDLERKLEVDTEVINSLLRKHIAQEPDLPKALSRALAPLKGSYSIAALFEDLDILFLATNTGSLHLIELADRTFLAFASELLFVQRALEKELAPWKDQLRIRQLQPGHGLIVPLRTKQPNVEFRLDPASSGMSADKVKATRKIHLLDGDQDRNTGFPSINVPKYKEIEAAILGEYNTDTPVIRKLRRCTKCILPETMPFIRFDANGVCNYCHRHQPRETQGLEKLHRAIEPFRKAKGEADCIVSFSGGRDSSYALHYAVKELGLRPLAFSYDWGMLTDLGRRNQARMTGSLGVEHILVSADIQQKRSYIRKNIQAWLKRPNLGIIPLFMAGDKQYFWHLNQVREKTGIRLVVYADNALEKTDFKYGFAGVELDAKVGKAYDIGRFNSLKLMSFYAKEYLANPAYINSSLLDTFTAYVSSYLVPKEYIYLFRYILWEEHQVENTLTKLYDWELATDTKSSWRIGDGTAAFYNYIYYTMAGFTEQDTFRSNQIREGVIDRAEGIRQAEIGNEPRVESIVWYCDTIGVDALSTIQTINAARKRYSVPS